MPAAISCTSTGRSIPKHELAAVTHAATTKQPGKPVLFHKVKGTRFPVLTSIYGTRERIAEVLGIEAKDFCREWSKLANAPGRRRAAACR